MEQSILEKIEETLEALKNNPGHKFNCPERSEWSCYLFGSTPQDPFGVNYTPVKGREPNWFVRWMMKLCFDCTWVKNNI